MNNIQPLAPIILFVYNRLWHTQQTVDALLKNSLAEESELFIFSDGEKNSEESIKQVNEVREYIRTIKGFKAIHITERAKNRGLANSVITGVTEIINKYERAIVLEDDIVTQPQFLEYMNEGLSFYEKEQKIFSLTGMAFPLKIPKTYKHDVYLAYRACSWSWGIWKDRWDLVDWEVKDFSVFATDKKAQKLFNRGGNDLTNMLKMQMKGLIDSWGIRASYSQFKHDLYGVYPTQSLVENIGMDGSGVHFSSKPTREDKKWICIMAVDKIELSMPPLNKKILKQFKLLVSSRVTLRSIAGKILHTMGLHNIIKKALKEVKSK